LHGSHAQDAKIGPVVASGALNAPRPLRGPEILRPDAVPALFATRSSQLPAACPPLFVGVYESRKQYNDIYNTNIINCLSGLLPNNLPLPLIY
jgi:hypothetical protein